MSDDLVNATGFPQTSSPTDYSPSTTSEVPTTTNGSTTGGESTETVNPTTGETGCYEAALNCACYMGECLNGLMCVNNICLPQEDFTTSGTESGTDNSTTEALSSTTKMDSEGSSSTTGEPEMEICTYINCYELTDTPVDDWEYCFVPKGNFLTDDLAVSIIVAMATKEGYTSPFDVSLDAEGSEFYNFTFLTDQEEWAIEFMEFRGIDLSGLSDDFQEFACKEKLIPIRDQLLNSGPYWTVKDPGPSTIGLYVSEGLGQVLKIGFASYPGEVVPLDELLLNLNILKGENPADVCQIFVSNPQLVKPQQELLQGDNLLGDLGLDLEGYVELELKCDPGPAALSSKFQIWPTQDMMIEGAELRLHNLLENPAMIQVVGQ